MLLMLLTAACRPVTDGETPAIDRAAAALVATATGMPLDQLLQMLEQELVAALEGDLADGDVNTHLIRAEAITDRLLDTQLPFAWLTEERYALDARLRQIQTLADRVVAQLRGRAPRSAVLEDAQTLLEDVRRIRAEVAAGGGQPPPPLSELLETEEAARVRARREQN